MTTEYAAGEESWSYLSITLTNLAVAVKGELACLDTTTGEVTVGGTSTTLLPIGKFYENKTGDGSATVKVRLFREINLFWWDNDAAPNNVVASDVGNEVYIVDGRTVSTSSAGSTRSKAGRVWAVSDTRGVLIEAGAAVTGPTGASGTGTMDSVATRTALKGVSAADRHDGEVLLVKTDNSFWRFDSASTATGDEAGEFVLEPTAGSGRWIRADKAFTAKIPIDFSMADGATILTVPDGFVLRLGGLPYWEVTTGWTGGTGSAIAVAASVTGYTAAGDILGGATGDVTATLGTAGIKPGTIGDKMDTFAEQQAFVLQAADTLTYEELTDAFTAGAGFVCLPVIAMTPA